MFIKNMGHNVRATVMGDLQTSKAQTSLCIRSDLEIYTKLHQTRPSAAVRSVGHDHFLVRKGLSRTTFLAEYACWSGHLFSVSS